MNEHDDIDTRADALEGELFALARSDAPSADARRRALLALGVGATVATAASLTEAAAAVKVSAMAGASVATSHAVKAVAVVTALKWAAVGAVAGTVVLGGAVGVEQLTSTRAVATSTSGQRSDNPLPAGSAPRSPSAPVRDLEPQPQPPEPVIRAPSDRDPGSPAAIRTNASTGAAIAPEPPRQEGSGRAPDSTSSLEEEVTRIDRARIALSSSAPARALAELDDYDARFPAGMMKPEATVVRIEAMVQNGNLAGAKALGRQFLIAYPSGGLSLRVHKVIGE